MSVAMLYALAGLGIGLVSYAFLMWIARKLERDGQGSESSVSAQQLRVVAHANLVLIPVLMYTFGAME
jgi:hypothetical protein